MSQEATNPVKYFTPAEVETFVQQSKFEYDISSVKDARTVCIDGRENNDDSDAAHPILAKPGGNAGCLMTAFAACNNLGVENNERIFKATEKAIGGLQFFTFHTDDDHLDEPGMGCGHLKNARQDAPAYGLTTEQMEFLFSKLPEILEAGGEQRIHHGKHDEKAILLVESDTWGIHSYLPTENGDGLQAFVYHQFLDTYRHDDIGRALYEEFSQDKPGYSEQDYIQAVKAVARKQLNETASRIANGVPMFSVRINDLGEVSITEL